jgi:hypothetical protein
MNLSDINSFVDLRVSSDTVTYTNAQRLISYNRWLQKIWKMILAAVDGWDIDDINQVNYPAVTTPLIANQRDYTLPASLTALKVKRVDVTYDGSNWVRAIPMDITTYDGGVGNDTNIDEDFTTETPRYDLKSHSIFLYPRASTAQVAAGAKLRVEYIREPITASLSDLSSTSAEPPIDESYHVMLWRMITQAQND